jgi:hypothetical protein
MAEKRMVHRNITKSDKLLRVINTRGWRAFALYTAHIPFLDKSGRMKANPLGLKGTTWEAHPITAEELAGDLDALADAGLLRIYRTPKNEVVMQYAKFDEEHDGFNKPHPNEPESEFPAADAPGCARVRAMDVVLGVTRAVADNVPTNVPDNVVDNVPPKVPPQRSDNVAPEYELEKEKENYNPPLTPPTPAPPPQDDEVEQSVTLANKRRANKHTTSILAQQHPIAKNALDDLQSVYSWKPAQYAVVADTFLELVRDHGEARVSAAATHVLASGATITHPIPYLKKLLADSPAPGAAPAKPRHDLDAIFGLERPVN